MNQSASQTLTAEDLLCTEDMPMQEPTKKTPSALANYETEDQQVSSELLALTQDAGKHDGSPVSPCKCYPIVWNHQKIFGYPKCDRPSASAAYDLDWPVNSKSSGQSGVPMEPFEAKVLVSDEHGTWRKLTPKISVMTPKNEGVVKVIKGAKSLPEQCHRYQPYALLPCSKTMSPTESDLHSPRKSRKNVVGNLCSLESLRHILLKEQETASLHPRRQPSDIYIQNVHEFEQMGQELDRLINCQHPQTTPVGQNQVERAYRNMITMADRSINQIQQAFMLYGIMDFNDVKRASWDAPVPLPQGCVQGKELFPKVQQAVAQFQSYYKNMQSYDTMLACFKNREVSCEGFQAFHNGLEPARSLHAFPQMLKYPSHSMEDSCLICGEETLSFLKRIVHREMTVLNALPQTPYVTYNGYNVTLAIYDSVQNAIRSSKEVSENPYVRMNYSNTACMYFYFRTRRAVLQAKLLEHLTK